MCARLRTTKEERRAAAERAKRYPTGHGHDYGADPAGRALNAWEAQRSPGFG
jgi:hypothetical protein